ncbi:putative ferric-chelate reductase 1 [Cryptotermes secundus]|uniref:Putative ferric-chelate reductase 1 n=1 Tax=Cryptotermes secundus TaxID=105785 RepID=A0A2J7Q8D6_9NEOP|nr:putative ferric-chelate reductase 1 homolog [Cryptotermes secundus]PNF24839.1 putative ferric-chelate reductase 1 [Cryptotermes secundus]
MAILSLPPFLLLTVAVLTLLHSTASYPSGAPSSTCSTLSPKHSSVPAQQSSSPYAVTPGKPSIAPGSKLRLMMTSTTGTPFKGFMLQARKPEGSDSAIGQFTALPNLTKTFTCPGGYQNSQNTVTHADPSKRDNLEFEWEAPDYYEGSVIFVATVVQDFSTFWQDVNSAPITVTKRAVDNSSQSTGISTTRRPVVTTPRATTTPPSVPETPPRRASVMIDLIYDGCGSKKTCFGFPGGCIDTKSCTAMVSCLVQGDRYEFEMKARNSAYVAVGLSLDMSMGEDSVVECVQDGTSGNSVNAYMSWNSGKDNKRLTVQDGISLKNSSFVDGTIYCKFMRDPITNVENTEFNLAKDKYHLLVAAGSSVREGNVGYHDKGRAAAETRQSLADVSIVSVSSNLLLRLHGAFMIGAWIGAAGIGILLARYFKQTWVGNQLCGKDQWFAWHRMFMLLTWGLTIAAFVLIFLELKDWSAEDNPHAILGCATTVLAFVQPIGAAFRPHPDSRRRPIFNWLHWLVGNVAHILGIVTIFFATKLTKAELPDWMDWILVGYVAFHVAVHLILSISSIVSERNNGKRVNSFPMKEMTSSRSPLHSPERKQDSPHSCFRKFMLGVYILVILLLVAALIIITVFAPIEDSWVKFQNMIAPNNTQGQ